MKPERIQSPERDPEEKPTEEEDAIAALKAQGWQCDDALLIDQPSLALVSDDGGPTAIGGQLGRYPTKGTGFYE